MIANIISTIGSAPSLGWLGISIFLFVMWGTTIFLYFATGKENNKLRRQVKRLKQAEKKE